MRGETVQSFLRSFFDKLGRECGLKHNRMQKTELKNGTGSRSLCWLTLSILRSAIALRTFKNPWHLDDEAYMKTTVGKCFSSHSTTLGKQLHLAFALFQQRPIFQLCRLPWSKISGAFSSLLCVFKAILRLCETGVKALIEICRFSMFFLNVSTL